LNKGIAWVLLGAVLVFFGSACGGGGGGTTTNTTSTTTTDGSTGLTNVQMIGVLQGTNVGVGLTNLAPGQSVQLEFIGTDRTNHQVVRQGSNFTTTAPASVATLSSSGLLSVVSASATTYSVQGTGPSGSQTRDLSVTSSTAFVSGKIRNINGTGVANVKVNFYLANGSLKATAATGPDGTFLATVPTNVTGFSIDIEQADPASGNQIYYREFAYGAKYYLNEADCPVAVPTLTAGSTTILPADVVLADRASGPPPPPSGCLGG